MELTPVGTLHIAQTKSQTFSVYFTITCTSKLRLHVPGMGDALSVFGRLCNESRKLNQQMGEGHGRGRRLPPFLQIPFSWGSVLSCPLLSPCHHPCLPSTPSVPSVSPPMYVIKGHAETSALTCGRFTQVLAPLPPNRCCSAPFPPEVWPQPASPP